MPEDERNHLVYVCSLDTSKPNKRSHEKYLFTLCSQNTCDYIHTLQCKAMSRASPGRPNTRQVSMLEIISYFHQYTFTRTVKKNQNTRLVRVICKGSDYRNCGEV